MSCKSPSTYAFSGSRSPHAAAIFSAQCAAVLEWSPHGPGFFCSPSCSSCSAFSPRWNHKLLPRSLSWTVFVKTRMYSAHSRAEARLLRQSSTFVPSAHPRGRFLSYRNEVSYTIKNRNAFTFRFQSRAREDSNSRPSDP